MHFKLLRCEKARRPASRSCAEGRAAMIIENRYEASEKLRRSDIYHPFRFWIVEITDSIKIASLPIGKAGPSGFQ
jgi:hypothetical protein